MKSIKEKSHEIGWVYSKHYDPIACKQEWCEMAAREGANYVLECIELYCKEHVVCNTNIKHLIDKLKEK